MVLHCCEDSFFVVLAVVCTSFAAINQGTNCRSALVPYGDTSKEYVCVGNTLLERCLARRSVHVTCELLLSLLCCCLYKYSICYYMFSLAVIFTAAIVPPCPTPNPSLALFSLKLNSQTGCECSSHHTPFPSPLSLPGVGGNHAQPRFRFKLYGLATC